MILQDIKARIGIAPRTTVYAVFRYHDSWLVWTGVRDMQAPYSKWEGTYLQLYDNGAVNRVSVYEDGSEDIINVKEG